MSEAIAEAPTAPNPNMFRDTIRSAMEGMSLNPETPESATPESVAPETPESATPEAKQVEPPADPLKEISKPDAPDFTLPIDTDGDPPAESEEKPEAKEKFDSLKKAGHRIEEVKREVKEVWKPKVAELEQSKSLLESRIAELESKAAMAEELEGKVKTYEEEMSVVRLEKHPKFKSEVKEPLRAKVAEATALADKYDIPSDELLDALELADEGEAETALEKLTSGLDVRPMDLLKLLKLHGEVKPILAKRSEMYAKADLVLAELEVADEQSSKQAALDRATERKQVAPAVAERMVAKIPFIKDDIGALVTQTGDTDIDALDQPNKVYNHLAGLALPKMISKAAAIQAENDRLLDELTALRKSLPSSQGGYTPSAGDDSPKTNFAATIKEALGRM